MFSQIERPHFYPGRTLFGDTQGPVVDTGCELPTGGHVYLSVVEAIHVGKAVEMVEAEVHEQALETIAGLETENDELREQIAELEAGQPKVIALDDARELLKARAAAPKKAS